MPARISIGDEAPNFDLTSTEGCILMLRDEVVRTAVVLYLFTDLDSDRVRQDLKALSEARERLAGYKAKVLAVAPVKKIDELLELQKELGLGFPLLRDDRGFLAIYGVEASEEGRAAAPALLVVDRRQQVRWVANPVTGMADALAEAEKVLTALPSPVADYPKKTINRLVSWWVN